MSTEPTATPAELVAALDRQSKAIEALAAGVADLCALVAAAIQAEAAEGEDAAAAQVPTHDQPDPLRTL